MKKVCVNSFVLLFCLLSLPAVAQESDAGYNPNSVFPVHADDVMYKKRVWRRMDLKEKQNKPFFAFNNEITKIIIDAVRAGELYPYTSDSLDQRMEKATFLENMKLPEEGGGLTEEEKALGFTEDDGWGGGWGDDDAAGGDPAAGAGSGSGSGGDSFADDSFLPNEVSILEIMEDIIFDKKRSRLYYDIQSIKLIIPANKFETGLFRVVGVFRYKDLVELFQSMPEKAIWFNPWNSQEHRNLADAFTLRLFNARITKVENPDDQYIVDIYNQSPRQGLMASQWMEDEIVKYEHDLWEF